MDFAKVAVAVLAAGQGRRFGSDKLLASLQGLPLGLHVAQTLADMPFGWRFAVCSKTAALAQDYASAGLHVLLNEHPEKSQAHSLHLAAEAASATSAEALLILLADMPYVTAAHVAAVVSACNGDIVASSDSLSRMPPAIFPRNTWPQLLATVGDSGARALLADARLVVAPSAELRDIDVVTDLSSHA